MQELKFSPKANKFLKDAQSSWKLRLYFLKNLPTAWWWGLRLKHADEHSCSVTIPYNWRTQNPFRSIYFAALAGAGEFSTGAPASAARDGRGNISMLVIDQKMEFIKKASTVTTFTCSDVQKVLGVVEKRPSPPLLACNNSLTTDTCPSSQASINGVLPSSSTVWTVAPLLSR